MDPLHAPPDAGLATLVERARAGDAAAFDGVFRFAAARVLLYVRLRMGTALRAVAEPDDVLQETWLEAHRALPRYEHRSAAGLSAWLCRLAESSLTALADRHSTQKRRARGHDLGPDVLARWADTATGVVTGAARGEAADRLERAVAALPDDERQVVLLRFFRGLPLDEIARLTGTPETTVRRRLGRAVATLGADFRGAA
jgi:RNA polymerase sigma-70 factor (ECF subfamily)